MSVFRLSVSGLKLSVALVLQVLESGYLTGCLNKLTQACVPYIDSEERENLLNLHKFFLYIIIV